MTAARYYKQRDGFDYVRVRGPWVGWEQPRATVYKLDGTRRDTILSAAVLRKKYVRVLVADLPERVRKHR